MEKKEKRSEKNEKVQSLFYAMNHYSSTKKEKKSNKGDMAEGLFISRRHEL